MTDILLDYDTWDIAIVDGDLVFIDTKEVSARQSTTITLRTNRGEWFRDIAYGIPYIKNENSSVQLLGSKDKGIFDSYLKEGMLSADEVISIISYQSTVEPITGRLTVNATLETETGQIEINETI